MLDPKQFYAGRAGRVTPGSRSYDLDVVDLGVLHVPSGRLGAADPFVTLGDPLVITIPPGSYPVSVTVADVSEELDGSHPREAYLSCWINQGEVARVELAVPEGYEAPPAGEYYGVGVDFGTVAFVDADALLTCMPEGNWYEDLFDPAEGGGWFGRMDDPDHYRAGSANIRLPLAKQAENLVLSHSGWGDGFYPVVKTLDADGKLLGVHINLGVVVDYDDEVTAVETPPAAPTHSRARGFLRRIFRS